MKKVKDYLPKECVEGLLESLEEKAWIGKQWLESEITPETNHDYLKSLEADEFASILDSENGRCNFCAYFSQVESPIAECLSIECEEGIREWLLQKRV